MLYTKNGLLLADKYERIVKGRGIRYYEVSIPHMIYAHLHIPRSTTWRQQDDMCYYVEYRSIDDAYVKVYWQKRKVSYADYKIGYNYIAVDDCIARDY